MNADTLNQPTLTVDGERVPSLDEIAAQHLALAPWVYRTPAVERGDFLSLNGTPIHFKLELLQAGGTFKAHGAFSNLLALGDVQRRASVTCVTSGNHAVAVAYAAMRLGISAKAVMLKTASPARIALCTRYGADVIMAENGADAFDKVRRIEADEGRFFVGGFKGEVQHAAG